MMRYLVIPIVLLLLTEFNTAPNRSGNSSQTTEVNNTSLDSIQQFLITTAANDFYKHQPPTPVGFRNVRIGHITGPNGEMRYILCGEFLTDGNEGWIPFLTIRTDPYEQWLGNQASAYCSDPSIIWEKVSDLSALLKNRYDALR